MKDKCCCWGVRLYSALAGIIFILIGVDKFYGVVPGLKTLSLTTAIIAIVVGVIGLVLVVMVKCCCANEPEKSAKNPTQA